MTEKDKKTRIHPTLNTDLVKEMKLFCIDSGISQQAFLSFAIAEALGLKLDDNLAPTTTPYQDMTATLDDAPFLKKPIMKKFSQ